MFSYSPKLRSVLCYLVFSAGWYNKHVVTIKASLSEDHCSWIWMTCFVSTLLMKWTVALEASHLSYVGPVGNINLACCLFLYISFIGTQPWSGIFIYCLWLLFTREWQSCIAVTETKWPSRPNTFRPWHLLRPKTFSTYRKSVSPWTRCIFSQLWKSLRLRWLVSVTLNDVLNSWLKIHIFW